MGWRQPRMQSIIRSFGRSADGSFRIRFPAPHSTHIQVNVNGWDADADENNRKKAYGIPLETNMIRELGNLN